MFADVEGAQVIVDGRALGTAPVSGLVLAPGPHEVRVTREGYQEVSIKPTVHAGRDEPVSLKLTPVSGGPPTPTVREPLVGGNLLSGGAVQSKAGAPSKPWYGRWYVWTAVGAVVAGGVVTSLMLMRPGKQDASQVVGPDAPPDHTATLNLAVPAR